MKRLARQKLFYLFTILRIGFGEVGYAQNKDAALVSNLIRNIAATQVNANGEYYEGMFPTFRQCGGAPHNYQPDNNMFFTGLVTFTLSNLLPYLDSTDQRINEQMIEKARKIFQHYRNKHGYPFYNFWPLGAPILPHSYYFKYLKSIFGQGEDADDAVIALMALNANDSTCKLLKERLVAVSNLSQRKIISTYRKYRNIPAYSTYLGFRMTPDFDFGVHCNILYFMYDRQLPLVKQDSATIYLLSLMIKNREYFTSPVYLSPYYVKPSILLYHLARLLGRFSIPELDKYKPQLIADLKLILSKTRGTMDKIILSTSLMRLGAEAPELNIESIEEFERSNQDQFVFFQARAAFSYPTPFKQIFLHWSYLSYYFYCPAYNKILWLEYLIEKNNKGSGQRPNPFRSSQNTSHNKWINNNQYLCFGQRFIKCFGRGIC